MAKADLADARIADYSHTGDERNRNILYCPAPPTRSRAHCSVVEVVMTKRRARRSATAMAYLPLLITAIAVGASRSGAKGTLFAVLGGIVALIATVGILRWQSHRMARRANEHADQSGQGWVARASIRSPQNAERSGTISIFSDRITFVSRKGGQVSFPISEIRSAELARAPLVDATWLWLNISEGPETLLTVTAPPEAVARALHRDFSPTLD
jgi:hypothetical protein